MANCKTITATIANLNMSMHSFRSWRTKGGSILLEAVFRAAPKEMFSTWMTWSSF